MASATIPVIRQGWSCDDPGLDTRSLTFIQVARGVQFDGTTLVLADLAPTMPYVAVPQRSLLGHISTGAFLDLWASPSTRSGVLSLADPWCLPNGDAVVLLARPRIRDAGLAYDVRLVDGILPTSSGSCVLYVNATIPAVADGRRGRKPDRRPR